MSNVPSTPENRQKWMLNKNIQALKDYTVKLEECEDRWFFHKMWDTSYTECGRIHAQMGGYAYQLRHFVKFDNSPLSITAKEKTFNDAYDGFQETCHDASTGFGGVAILLGMVSTVLGGTMPCFGYMCYTSWDDPLGCFRHVKAPFLTAATAAVTLLSAGIGSIIYGMDKMDICKPASNDHLVEAFINYANTLQVYGYDMAVTISSSTELHTTARVVADCIDEDCYQKEQPLLGQNDMSVPTSSTYVE